MPTILFPDFDPRYNPRWDVGINDRLMTHEELRLKAEFLAEERANRLAAATGQAVLNAAITGTTMAVAVYLLGAILIRSWETSRDAKSDDFGGTYRRHFLESHEEFLDRVRLGVHLDESMWHAHETEGDFSESPLINVIDEKNAFSSAIRLSFGPTKLGEGPVSFASHRYISTGVLSTLRRFRYGSTSVSTGSEVFSDYVS